MKRLGFKKIAYIFLTLVFLCPVLTGCASYVVDDFMAGEYKKAMIEIMEGHPWETAAERRAKDRTIVRNSTDDNTETVEEETKEKPSEAVDKGKEKANKKKKDKDKKKKTEEPDTIEADEVADALIGKSNFTYKDIEDKKAEIIEEPNFNFYYSQLNDAKKNLYAQLYMIVERHAENETLITLDVDAVDETFLCLVNDHPEFYYVSGYSMNEYSIGNKRDSLEFTPAYTKTAQEIEGYNNKIYDYASECLALCPKGDDYETIKYIYEYIIRHTEYNLSAPENQNILSVFINGSSVCNGYAKATQYLLDRLNIPCILVSGTASTGESHAWNMVLSNGKWYFLDTTWGDASYTGNAALEIPDVNYDYLCANKSIMRRTHHLKNKYDLPPCEWLDDYYYVREGTYFTWFDEEKLKNLIVDKKNKGQQLLFIKCDKAALYHEMIKELFTKGRISEFMYNATDVHYVRMDDSYNLLIYL